MPACEGGARVPNPPVTGARPSHPFLRARLLTRRLRGVKAWQPAARRRLLNETSLPIREVDSGELRLPPSRIGRADPWKLQQQIRRFGSSKDGMPPILVYEAPNGALEISDGVTRATRIAKLAPGETVPVIVIGRYRRDRPGSACVRDRI